MTMLAIAFAVASAACAALGAYLQHGAVTRVSDGGHLRIGNIADLVRDSRWMLGLGCLVGTAVFQILAISLAPLVIVQPVVVLALPMVAMLTALAAGRAPGGLTVTGILATTIGLAAFVTLAAQRAVATDVTGGQAVQSGSTIGLGVAALLLFASLMSGVARCVTLAVAAGALYGLVSVLIRHITQTVAQDGGLASVPLLSVLVLVAAHVTGSWLVQVGYASGPADLVVACHTVVNPATAVAIGVSVLGETTGIGAVVTTELAVCAGVAIAGIALLARANSRLPEAVRGFPA